MYDDTAERGTLFEKNVERLKLNFKEVHLNSKKIANIQGML